MAQTTVRGTARRAVPLTTDCQLGTAEGWPQAHARCRGNGPLRVAGFHTPVLPAQTCGCPCHTPAGGAR